MIDLDFYKTGDGTKQFWDDAILTDRCGLQHLRMKPNNSNLLTCEFGNNEFVHH